MTRIVLVRHGRATGGWDTDPDPGLDDLGFQQAAAVVESLASMSPGAVVTSPLLRARETARPFADHVGIAPLVAPEVTEIPTPPGIPFAERGEWLRGAMAGTWADLGPSCEAFRDQLIAYLRSLRHDTVVFTHFIAINAVIGHVNGDDRVVLATVDNCSLTELQLDATGKLSLKSTGHEADSVIG